MGRAAFMFLTWVLPIFLSYLIGAINFSYIVTSILKGIDIREHGSGNAGATNTFRVIGKTPAIVVGVLDALKGVACLIIGILFSHNDTVVLMCGLAAIIGHNWPIFLGFRGGKGIATTIGVSLILFTLATVIAGLVAITTIFITRYVSLGSLVFTFCIPIVLLFRGHSGVDIWFGMIVFLLAVIRHRENIQRLLQGTERKT
jgi:glycerol-3-phosphate acyltransferase PlsY